MANKPNFTCPHCGNDNWRENETSSLIEGIDSTSTTTGKRSGKYMEAITFVCVKCGYIVFFRIP